MLVVVILLIMVLMASEACPYWGIGRMTLFFFVCGLSAMFVAGWLSVSHTLT